MTGFATLPIPTGRTGVAPDGFDVRLTHFQVRSAGDAPLAAIAVTMPPWPGDDEAVPVRGPW